MEIPQPKCASIPKLEEQCLRKLVTYLWKNSKIFNPNSKCYSSNSGEEIKDWQARTEPVIQGKVKKLESECVISETVSEKITELIRPIGFQIKRWTDFQQYHLRNTGNIMWPTSTNIIWKSNNTVNYSKTAEEIINCASLTDLQCYILACLNCLEKIIPTFWNKLPEETKSRFVNPLVLQLQVFWQFIINGKVSDLDNLWRQSNRNYRSFFQWAFEYFSRIGFLVPTEYFYKKMTEQEREESIIRAAEDILTNNEDIEYVGFRPFRIYYFGKEMESETFCWIFTIMTPQQQREIVQKHTIEVFSCFSFYPWPDFLMENADLFWSIIPSRSYTTLISTLASRFGSNSNHFFKVFVQKFLVQSPPAFKKRLVVEEDIPLNASHILSCLSKDSESMKIFLRCLQDEDRKVFLFQDDVIDFFCYRILNDDFEKVRECLLTVEISREDSERFELAFKRRLERMGYDEKETRKFENLFHFLNIRSME